MNTKKVLVIDEPGFSRVCAALLERDGFASETLVEAGRGDDGVAGDFDLIITSFPYGAGVFSRLSGRSTPVLVLADCITRELLQHMKFLKNTRCLIKPIDFEKFGGQVQRMINRTNHMEGGFEIA